MASSSKSLSATLNRRVVARASPSSHYSSRLPQRRNVITTATTTTTTYYSFPLHFHHSHFQPRLSSYPSCSSLFASRSQQFYSTRANMPVKIESDARYKEIVDSESQDRLVVIDFFATWCGPCRMIAPVMEKLSVDFPQASFYKIDVDEREVVAQDAGIRSMPTFLFFKNGKKICEVIGANSAALRAAVQNNV